MSLGEQERCCQLHSSDTCWDWRLGMGDWELRKAGNGAQFQETLAKLLRFKETSCRFLVSLC